MEVPFPETRRLYVADLKVERCVTLFGARRAWKRYGALRPGLLEATMEGSRSFYYVCREGERGDMPGASPQRTLRCAQ